jgi:ribosome biogenesis GTPase
MTLSNLGWTSELAFQFQTHAARGLVPARVVRGDRDRCLVLTAGGVRAAEVTGRFRHDAQTPSEFPSVGDWVAVQLPNGDGVAAIHAVLPRRSAFVRRAAGEATAGQVVAANVDVVFLVAGLDGDFNPRRIERYVAAAWDSGAEPVLVLNKLDLADDPEGRIAGVKALAPGVPVVAVSALDRTGIDALAPWLTVGRTVALLGSSGVGKSTLANALLGEERQATGAVREDDARGRHTTTHRELIVLRSGALLLDTPGMRELGLWSGDGEGLSEAFADLVALAGRCRYRDCGHDAEPGCAVRRAVADGSLAAERLESWHKLQRELHWLAIRQDQRLRAAEQSKWKAIHKSMKHHPKADRWRKS